VDESGGQVLVSPNVFWEPDGYLVADAQEARIFSYDTTGRLEWTSGTKGRGPGEYISAVGVVRLPSGNILAADWNYKFVYIAASGDSIIRTVTTPFYHLQAMELIDDTTLLVTSAITDTAQVGVAHIWSLSGDSIRHSFFAPADPADIVAQTAGWTVADVRGDTIALAFATKDSVFLFDLAGQELSSFSLGSANFRAASTPPSEAFENPLARMEWVASFDLVNGVHILSNGQYLVSYRSMTKEGQKHHYVLLAQNGDPVWEVRNLSRLLAVSDQDNLLMVDPEALAPNKWLIAQL
jgi:outer membrane protein assembly factor BamB